MYLLRRWVCAEGRDSQKESEHTEKGVQVLRCRGERLKACAHSQVGCGCCPGVTKTDPLKGVHLLWMR